MSDSTCPKTGKRRPDRHRAEASARWWRHNWFARMAAYHCRPCGAWHIGNNGGRRPRRVKR